MAMGTGLLALALVAAEGPSCPQVETTTYQVRVLTLDGLEWRTSAYTRLQPVARQGASTIWTADKALAAALAGRAKDDAPCHTITAVGEAVMSKADVIYYNAALERVADGPINQASALAFMPRPEPVEERFSIKVEGRKLDQGVLTRISLEETHIDVIHSVAQSETLAPRDPKEKEAAKASRTPAEVGRDVLNVVLPGCPDGSKMVSVTSSVKIPEVTRASVAGEWLIPNDGVLLVSLGVKTAADRSGRAVVRERVAVIEACPGATAPEGSKLMTQEGRPATAALAQPATPARSIPEAIDPSGKLIELPPLPEALASADLDRIKPEPNQPSPQAPIFSSPSADLALARTSFDAAPQAPNGDFTVLRRAGCPLTDEEMRASFPPGVYEALKKANIEISDDTNIAVFTKAPQPRCEQCEAEAAACRAATTGTPKVGQVSGGMTLAPADFLAQAGFATRPADGTPLLDFAAFLDAAETKDQAAKMVGQTRTSVVPLGGNVSIELKATVVPTPPAPQAARVEAPTPRR